jgi:hypothetical protein
LSNPDLMDEIEKKVLEKFEIGDIKMASDDKDIP